MNGKLTHGNYSVGCFPIRDWWGASRPCLSYHTACEGEGEEERQDATPSNSQSSCGASDSRVRESAGSVVSGVSVWCHQCLCLWSHCHQSAVREYVGVTGGGPWASVWVRCGPDGPADGRRLSRWRAAVRRRSTSATVTRGAPPAEPGLSAAASVFSRWTATLTS